MGMYFYCYFIENKYKCPHFGSIETIFEGQTQWDSVQISSQNEKIEVFKLIFDFKYAQKFTERNFDLLNETWSSTT